MAVIDASGIVSLLFTLRAFPRSVFYDAFNRADEDLGASSRWTNVNSAVGAAQVVNNELVISSDTGTGNPFLIPDCGTDNHWVQFEVKELDEYGAAWVCCRLSNVNNFLGLRIAGVFYQVCKRVGGEFTFLATIPRVAQVGDVVRLAAVNDSWKVYVNGEMLGTGLINPPGDIDILPASSRQGIVTDLPFGDVVFVDSTALPGGDGSKEDPYNSLSDITISDASIIYLARGSYWAEGLDNSSETAHGVVVCAYGSGKMPIIDGADEIIGTWTQPDAINLPNVWSIDLAHNVASGGALSLWIDGDRPFWVDSLEDVNDTENSFYFPNTGTPSTLYIHSTTDPNINGSTYEYSAREAGIWAADRWAIAHVHVKRAGGLNGAIVLRNFSHAHFCLMEDGVYHNGHCDRSSTMYDCIAWKCDWPIRGTAYMLSKFSRISDEGPLTAPAFVRCVAIASEEVLQFAITNGLSIYGMRVSGDGQAASRWEEVIWDSCSAKWCTKGIDTLEAEIHRDINTHVMNCHGPSYIGTNAPLSYSVNPWVEEANVGTDTYRMISYEGSGTWDIEGLRLYLENDGSDGLVSAFNGNLVIRKSAIRVKTPPGFTFIIRQAASDKTLTMTQTVIAYDEDAQEVCVVAAWPDTMDNNVYAGPNGGEFVINGTTYATYTNYEAAGLPYDQNSGRITDPDDAFVDAANGDFRNKEGSPAIALGAGIENHNVSYTPIPSTEELEEM